MSVSKINELRVSFESLGIYRGLLKDSSFQKLYELIKYIDEGNYDIIKIISLYNDFYFDLMQKSNGCGLKEYMIERILFDENLFAKKASQNIEDISLTLKEAVSNDLDSLESISSFTRQDIKDIFDAKKVKSSFYKKIECLGSWDLKVPDSLPNFAKSIINKFLSTSNWNKLIDDLVYFHKKHGWGIFARYRGFAWDGKGLVGVESLDPIRLCELVNYERQKKIVVDNTLAFLKGHKVNNILLYGSRGTGKSSTVKAILNEYYEHGLRVVEIFKENLHTFPNLVKIIKDIPLKFIIFIDDLSFEGSEGNYNKLKAILEGGLEAMPDNVVIYATSNRRHLVKERFSDRSTAFSDDEVHFQDSLQEKLSLADRFGIVVTYPTPTQQEYLEIVDSIAKSRGIEIDENLHKLAIQWEMSYNGRSPRTARQFVDWYEINLKDRVLND